MDRRRIEERTGIRGEEGGYRKDDKEFYLRWEYTPGSSGGRRSVSSVIVPRGNFDVPNKRRKRSRYRRVELKYLMSCLDWGACGHAPQ